MLLMLLCFALIPPVGGVLSSPTMGFANMAVPLGFCCALRYLKGVMTYELEHLHAEARRVLKMASKIDAGAGEADKKV